MQNMIMIQSVLSVGIGIKGECAAKETNERKTVIFFPVTHTHKHTGYRQSLQCAGLFEQVFVSFHFEWMRRARLD